MSAARQLVWVFVAGGGGAVLRVVLGGLLDAKLGQHLPHVGTLVVNMIGCLAIGVAAAMLPAGPTRLAVVGGLLGGFTTYSAFALFSVDLLQSGRSGVAVLQIGLHIAVGMLCAWAGLVLGRLLGGGGTTP